jgi:hypothetical protein
MTGIRHLVWETTNFDVGNKLAVLITLAAVFAVFVGPFRVDRSPDSAIRAWQIVATVTALTLMFAPLHTYDFVLIALVALVPLRSRPTITGIALVGLAVMLRAENMADLTGFHQEGVNIFPGSRLLSLGALVFGATVIASMAYWNRSGATEADEAYT